MATTNTAATLIDRALKRIEEVKETLFKSEDEHPQSQVSHEKQYLNDIARGNWKLKHNDSICIRTVPVVGFPSGYVSPVFKLKTVERRPFLSEICNGYKLRHVEFNFINDKSVPNLDKQAFKLKTAVDYRQLTQEIRTFSDSTNKLKHVTNGSDRSAPQISDIRMSKFFQADSTKVTQEKSKDIDTKDKSEKKSEKHEKGEKSKDHKKEKKGKNSEKDLDTQEHTKEGKIKHDKGEKKKDDKEGKKSEKKKDKSEKKSHDIETEKHESKSSKKNTKGKDKDGKEGSKKKKMHEDEVSHKKNKKDHHSKKNKEGKKGKKNHSDEETTTDTKKTIEIYEREEIIEVFKEGSKDHGTKGDKKSKKHEKSKDHENKTTKKDTHQEKHQVFIVDGDKHKNDNVPITVAIDKTGAS